MNENKRLLVIFGVIVLVVAVILIISFWPEPDKTFTCGVKADGDYDKLGSVNYEQYQCLYESDDKNALVVADELSNKEKETLNNVATRLGHALYYVDTESFSSDELKSMKKELKYNDNSFDKNVILTIQSEKVDDFKEEIFGDEDALFEFLQDANLAKFACEVVSDPEYENLGALTYDQYQCLYESGEPFALILAQTTCSYCLSYKPIIDEYAADNNVPVYIIEIDELTDDETNSILSSLSYFDDNTSWGTPLTIGIKDKEVVAEINGYTDDENTIKDFFVQLGLQE